jgi:hypothetical protein
VEEAAMPIVSIYGYSIKIGLSICTRDDPFVILVASSSSKLYYQKKVGMTYKDSIFLNTGEVHVFSFTRQTAIDFCHVQEKRYGQAEAITNRKRGVGFTLEKNTTVNAGTKVVMTREEWRNLYRGELGKILDVCDSF